MATYDELYGNNPAYTKDAYGTYRDASGNVMYDMTGAKAGEAAISSSLPGVNFNGGVTPASYSSSMMQPDNSGFSYGGQAAGQTAGDAYEQTQAVLTNIQQQQNPYTTSGMFGSGVATPGRTPEQLSTIKNAWSQYSAGQMPATEIKKAMEQYGVNFADISAATGLPIDSLVASLNQGLTAPKPQTPAVPTYGSPYNPGITAPNPDGSGRPLGTTHPASGMVNLQSGDSDYNTQMQNYYKAYFGGASPDMGMLNSWYSSEYKPSATGYQKPSTSTTTPSTNASNTDPMLGVLGGDSQAPSTSSGGSILGTGRMTDAIASNRLNDFQSYISLGLAPAAAISLINSGISTYAVLDLVNNSDDPIGMLNRIQGWTETEESSGGSTGGSSYGGFGGVSGAEGDPYSY